MATDANGNPIPVIDPQLAAILNAAGSMPPSSAWPQSKKKSGAVDIPVPEQPANTDTSTAEPPVAEKGAAPFKYGGAPASVLYPPAPVATNLPTTQTPPITPSSPNTPPIPASLAFSRWNLTQPTFNQPTSDPLSAGAARPGFTSYMQASTDPNTGMPAAANPNLTKLGKLLTILRGAGLGAAVGSTQPTFGRGLMAANEFENQQALQNQAVQRGAAQTALARQQLQLAPLEMQTKQQQLQLQQQQMQMQAEMMPLQKQLMEQQVRGIKDVRWTRDAQGNLIAQGVDAMGNPVGPAYSNAAQKNAGFEAVPINDPDQDPTGELGLAPVIGNRDKTTGNVWYNGKIVPPTMVHKWEQGIAQNPFAAMKGKLGAGEGEAAIQNMTPEEQRLIRKIANYDEDPGRYKSRNPASYRDLMDVVNAYSPQYREGEFRNRNQVRTYWTTGQGMRNIQSLNMVAHHLDELDKANDALNNGNRTLLNEIANNYKVNWEGKSAPVVFEAVKNAVAGELGTTFKGASATDPEIAKMEGTISSSLARQINRDVIRQDVGLVRDRLAAMQYTYENSTKNPADFQIVSPQAQQIFNRLGGTGAANAGSTPDTHVFNARAWAAANPGKDVNAAIAKAKAQGYQIQQ